MSKKTKKKVSKKLFLVESFLTKEGLLLEGRFKEKIVETLKDKSVLDLSSKKLKFYELNEDKLTADLYSNKGLVSISQVYNLVSHALKSKKTRLSLLSPNLFFVKNGNDRVYSIMVSFKKEENKFFLGALMIDELNSVGEPDEFSKGSRVFHN